MVSDQVDKYLTIFTSGFEGAVDGWKLRQIEVRRVTQNKDRIESLRKYRIYRCPTKGCVHYATIPVDFEECKGEQVLTCYHCNKRWMCNFSRERHLKNEEERFLAILSKYERSQHFGKGIPPELAFRLRTEQGIPFECMELTDTQATDDLMDAFREQSRRKVKRLTLAGSRP